MVMKLKEYFARETREKHEKHEKRKKKKNCCYIRLNF